MSIPGLLVRPSSQAREVTRAIGPCRSNSTTTLTVLSYAERHAYTDVTGSVILVIQRDVER